MSIIMGTIGPTDHYFAFFGDEVKGEDSRGLLNIATQMITLYAPAQSIFSVAKGVDQTCSSLIHLTGALLTGNVFNCSAAILNTSLGVSLVAGAILFPKVEALSLFTMNLLCALRKLTRALITCYPDLKQAGSAILDITQASIDLGSVLTPRPELIALSFLSYAIRDQYQATKDLLAGRKLEFAGNLTLSYLRFSKSKPYLDETLVNNPNLQKDIQEKFDKLYQAVVSPFDFETM